MNAAPGRNPARTRIKFCGMFRDEDIEAVFRTRPDLCGFVVDFPRSHRSVTIERLAELCRLLDGLETSAGRRECDRISRVGVFVDKHVSEVARAAQVARLDAVQLHGNEDDDYVADLRKLLSRLRPPREGSPAPRIIQAFRVRDSRDVRRASLSSADLVLLDSGQGSGKAFDWTLTRSIGRPFLLAGGLDPDNVASAVRAVRPWGVDMSSGIETSRLKDERKMLAAVSEVRKADASMAARP